MFCHENFDTSSSCSRNRLGRVSGFEHLVVKALVQQILYLRDCACCKYRSRLYFWLTYCQCWRLPITPVLTQSFWVVKHVDSNADLSLASTTLPLLCFPSEFDDQAFSFFYSVLSLLFFNPRQRPSHPSCLVLFLRIQSFNFSSGFYNTSSPAQISHLAFYLLSSHLFSTILEVIPKQAHGPLVRQWSSCCHLYTVLALFWDCRLTDAFLALNQVNPRHFLPHSSICPNWMVCMRCVS